MSENGIRSTEKILSMIAEDAAVTEEKMREAAAIFQEDGENDCLLIEEFLAFYSLAEKSLGLLKMRELHACTQKYAARLEGEIEQVNPLLPFLYLKEMDYFMALHSFSECFRYINLILDLDRAPDFCVAAALVQAIDLFMSCSLKQEARKYVDMTRTFSLLCNLPDTYRLILDCNLMQGYAFVGDKEKYQYYRKRLYSYDDEIYDDALETVLRIFSLGAKALLYQDRAPEQEDLNEVSSLFGGNLSTYGISVDYASVIVPIFRWVKGYLSDSELIRYSLKMIDVCVSISDKLDLYAFLVDEVRLNPEQNAFIHQEFHDALRVYYENSVENHGYEVLGEIVSHEINKKYKRDSLTDILTDTGNRYAYERALEHIPQEPELSEEGGFTIFVMDVNGLKRVNDTYGHAAGDAYIKGASGAIAETIGQFGEYFRIGGDEFTSIWIGEPADPAEAVMDLRNKLAAWTDEFGNTLSMAVGYVRSTDYPGAGVQEIVHYADEAMYADKRSYYAQKGRDRRR